MCVFVLDKRKRPLISCSEKRARLLLQRGRAVVHRRYPFTIRLEDLTGGATQPIRLKLDPGASVTGVVQGISHRHCRIIHRADGYAYAITSPATRTEGAAPPGPEEPGLRREKN